MPRKSQYQTKQMSLLAAYLAGKEGQHVTAGDICEYFAREGESIGTATVYRHLERMVAQGTVAKYTVDGTSGSCFEYIGSRSPSEHPACYHCKCEVCGKQCRKPGEPFDTHKRTLTVAHLNHTPEDVRPVNLKAMCAPCHLRYGAQHHAETRRAKKNVRTDGT